MISHFLFVLHVRASYPSCLNTLAEQDTVRTLLWKIGLGGRGGGAAEIEFLSGVRNTYVCFLNYFLCETRPTYGHK
jgi:hypothetical protein